MKAGWKTVKLADVAEMRPPKSEAKLKGLKPTDEVGFLPMEDLTQFQKHAKALKTRTMSEVSNSYTYFANGDVLMAKISPCFQNGKMGIATGLPSGVGYGSSEYFVFRPSKELSAEWLFYYLQDPAFRRNATGKFSGNVGQQRLPKELIEELEIPLPPLAEQKRIVALLDEAFAGIDEAKAKAEASMDLALETLNSFLEIEFNAENSELSPIGEIFTTMTGTTPPKSEASYYGKDFLFVKPPELRGGLIVETEDGLTKEGAAFARIAPRNSILVSCIGILGKVGWADKPVAFNQQINAILPREDRAHWKYMLFQMKSPKFRKSLTEASTGTTVYMVNKSKFNQLMVRLPSLRHQATAAERFAEIDQLQNELTENQKKRKEALNSLKASLLTQAFAGELTA